MVKWGYTLGDNLIEENLGDECIANFHDSQGRKLSNHLIGSSK
jgi:hypothetical protein